MLAQINNFTHVPTQFLKATGKKTVAAVQNVQLIERHNVSLLAEEKDALKRYIHASTPLCSIYVIDKENAFYAKLHTYLTVHCGFNLLKDENLFLQVQAVITQTGRAYPDFAIYEIFDAIDFCLAKNPELCRSYDSKEGQSSFTAVWLCKIVNYYCTHATSARQIVGRLLAPIEKELSEKEAIRQKNLAEIKKYRNSCLMIFRNANYFLHENRFDFDLNANFGGKTYLDWLYENMQVVGLILPGNKEKHPYQAIWDKWKNVEGYGLAQKIALSKKEIIENVFNSIPSEMIEAETEWAQKYDMLQFAKDLGFFQSVPEMNLEIEMSILEMLEKYGKGIVNVYPLQQHEVEIRSQKNTGIFSQLKEYLNSFHVEHK